MPANRDRRYAKSRPDFVHRQPFEFVHHNDRAATRRQYVERGPHGGACDEGGFRVGSRSDRRTCLVAVSPANRGPAPLVASNVDEHANQPRFLVREARWNRVRRARSLQIGFLDEIEGVIGRRNQPTGETVQPLVVSVEQGSQPLRRRAWQGRRKRGDDGQTVHTVLNVPTRVSVGFRFPTWPLPLASRLQSLPSVGIDMPKNKGMVIGGVALVAEG